MVRYILIKLVALYRYAISPIFSGLGASCRFYPSCSAYAREALEIHPWPRAVALIAWRLVRCGPWHPGGYDPVNKGPGGEAADNGGKKPQGRSQLSPGLS